MNFAECTRSYGENCRFPCSVHCINKTCDRFDGRCLVVCKDDSTCDPGRVLLFNILMA